MFKQILKDERGLSLVELLAVVVIMSIIAGIGAVAITGVIQKNREDAGVSTVQSLMSAANLYQASNGDTKKAIGSTEVTAETLVTDGFITQVSGVKKKSNLREIKFTLNGDNKLYITVDKNVFEAGKKSNENFSGDEKETANLDRDKFWGNKKTP